MTEASARRSPAASGGARTRVIEKATGVTEVRADLMTIARQVAAAPEVRRSAVGFIGYGETKKGDGVLLAVPSLVDQDVIDVVVAALREKGARVDTIVIDEGVENRRIDAFEQEVAKMRREPLSAKPRVAGRRKWVRDLAEAEGYDLLIHGSGGAVPKSKFRWEAFPWWNAEQLAQECNTFPQDVHRLINEHTWSRITDNPGGRIHLTDPEGTDLRYTILEKPFHDGRHDYGLRPKWGHLMGHTVPPIEPEDDSVGVVAGTMNEYGTAPFPRIKVQIEHARLMEISGGGEYGDVWRSLEEESKDNQYPCFPGPGLFWLWEAAIGTNPKVRRLSNFGELTSHGYGWERRLSGVIHLGIGTRSGSSDEGWAGDRNMLYGHLHVQIGYPTLVVETKDGREISVIEHGRLAAFDDPEVRDAAARHGDPDVLLRRDWTPPIPGISTEGTYEQYAEDPVGWQEKDG